MPPVDYINLSEAEARANLQRHVAGLDDKVAWLEDRLGHALGTDDNTLVQAWGWFLRWAPEHRDDNVDPPDWYERDEPPCPDGLTASELRGVDAVAAQWARVLQRAAPSCAGTSARSRRGCATSTSTSRC